MSSTKFRYLFFASMALMNTSSSVFCWLATFCSNLKIQSLACTQFFAQCVVFQCHLPKLDLHYAHSPRNASKACSRMLTCLVEVNVLTPYVNPLNHLSCQMVYKMPFQPQHPIVFHPWGCPCLMVIEMDFVPKGVE